MFSSQDVRVACTDNTSFRRALIQGPHIVNFFYQSLNLDISAIGRARKLFFGLV